MEEIVKKLKEKTGDPKGDFTNMLTFGKNGSIKKKYCLEFCYHKKNRNGTFQKKVDYLKVAISFNPFTGEKLD